MNFTNVVINGEEHQKYHISDTGVVYSVKTKINLKPRLHSGGYHMVTLWLPKQKEAFVHRLVAQAFIPNPENKKCVNHMDGNKHNNHVSNLEWVTDSENQKHSYSIGLNSRNGMNNGKSKLDEQQVLTIRSLRSSMTGVALSKMFNVSEGTIRQICKRRAWAHI
jgi:hypothetical protein